MGQGNFPPDEDLPRPLPRPPLLPESEAPEPLFGFERFAERAVAVELCFSLLLPDDAARFDEFLARAVIENNAEAITIAKNLFIS
jgi:hypothetical protein